jgi:ABC-type polysaccharide/polyol phosphate export permease
MTTRVSDPGDQALASEGTSQRTPAVADRVLIHSSEHRGWRRAVLDAVNDLVSSRELLRTLVERNIRLRRKRASIGVVWPLLAPFFLLALYVFVFQHVFRAPVPHYTLFLFAGLLPWSFLALALGDSVTRVSTEAELIRRARFPYELLPIAAVLTLGIYFVVSLIGFAAYMAIAGYLKIVLIPVLLLPVIALLLLVMSLAMLLALVDVYNRDLRAVLANLLTLWFFIVPIVYRQSMVGPKLSVLRSIDPMNITIGQFRDILLFGHLSYPGHLVLMLVICTSLFVASLAIFRRFASELPKNV